MYKLLNLCTIDVLIVHSALVRKLARSFIAVVTSIATIASESARLSSCRQIKAGSATNHGYQ